MSADSTAQAVEPGNNPSSSTKRPSTPAKRQAKRRRVSKAVDKDLSAPRPPVTLYDAVAGRVTDSGIRGEQHSRQNYWSAYRNWSTLPLTPVDALFRLPDAPQLYEEIDLYGAHRWLSDPPRTSEDPSGQDLGGRGALPDSDMLKAIHEYVAEFYAASTVSRGRYDWRSMDETALLAMGILMEEEIKRSLGENGWAVFTEAADDEPREIKGEIVGRPGTNLRDVTAAGNSHSRKPSGEAHKTKQAPKRSAEEEFHSHYQDEDE